VTGHTPLAALGLPAPEDSLAEEGFAHVLERTSIVPEVAVVLGSGLGDAVRADVESDREFVFSSLPGFPSSSVPGHAGRLVMGKLYGVPAAVFLGRIHLYEGHGIGSTTLIPRLATLLGANTLVLTNAAGGIGPGLRVGQLMLITDHINLLGANPLTGWRFPNGQPAFADLSAVYTPKLREMAEAAATEAGVDIASGVYAGLPGPSYETPAEIRYLRGIGADAVGMSTVPEAVAAAALRREVLAISCITNVAGAQDTHEDVLAAAAKAGPNLRAVLERVLSGLGKIEPEPKEERRGL
jgi:purine-nucleoside phosphorylase